MSQLSTVPMPPAFQTVCSSEASKHYTMLSSRSVRWSARWTVSSILLLGLYVGPAYGMVDISGLCIIYFIQKPRPGPSRARAKPYIMALAWPDNIQSRSPLRPSQSRGFWAKPGRNSPKVHPQWHPVQLALHSHLVGPCGKWRYNRQETCFLEVALKLHDQ
jgi:hypothetical protein